MLRRVSDLRGRVFERTRLERLVEDARGGRSAALVLRGEPGIGKTALLEYATGRAFGLRLVRCAGVQSEMELPFAGLHQLCAPLLGRLDPLPEPQRDALRVALGLAAGPPADRFLVALAVLSLLSEAAPVLCLIDDAQWLDRASAQALGFVARRLLAESVAMVFAVRSPEAELNGLPELLLSGLDDEDARALLPGWLDEHVRDRMIAETRGNPLALLELPVAAGGFALPAAGGVEEHYRQRLAGLEPGARRLLLLAAADPTGDATLVLRAAAPAVAAAPEDLLEIGARVRFRHPLVRSAVYGAATAPERRSAHAALAAATDPERDPDRRAWHRAHASAGPDAAVAGELIHSAGRAQRRGGIAAAAAFWERAVALTPDPAERAARALPGAEAKFAAGDLDAAAALLAIAQAGPLDELGLAHAQRMRAQIVFALRRGSEAPPLLAAAAEQLAPLSAPLARETYLEALVASIYAGRLGTVPVVPLSSDPLALGLARRLSDGYSAAAPLLKHALRERPAALDWSSFSYNIAAQDLWDDEAWFELASGQARVARAAGTLSLLPYALDHLAGHQIHAGELAHAEALWTEAARVRAGALPYIPLQLAAWRGEERAALAHAHAMTHGAMAHGEGCALTVAEYATAVLYNGLGHYARALEAAEQAVAADDVATSSWALPELVEAAARAGRRELAAAALERLAERAQASGTAWARGLEARSRALVEAREEHHVTAIEALERLAAHRARARLGYGEWLRREGRRGDAREQLRAAHEAFDAMGARGFAERARRELQGTGGKASVLRGDAREALTAQEELIARLARAGRTNPEIGAELFLSPRTVEWHLHKVFAKLGISSRRGLQDALDGA